ncbi:MAG: xanthine dehydrogenase family protein molybdopterin-binding subunit [Pseudomonadota bacterium]
MRSDRYALPTEPADATTRRTFLKIAGSGLVLALAPLPLPSGADAAAASGRGFAPNPFLIIAPDDTVTVVVKHLDKGQGSATGLATLVAEELDARWEQVLTEFAPADATRYNNLLWGPMQGTGGSTAIANSFLQYRKAGATARAMLVAAAAKAWGVPAAEITVQQGRLAHVSGKSATLGEMASAAAEQSVPAEPALKQSKDFVHIGKRFQRVDSVAKTEGRPIFTLDVQQEGMVVAVVQRPPRFGGRVARVDAAAAKAIKGVVDVLTIPEGVAVLATSTWPALKARDALRIEWDESAAERRGTPELMTELSALLDRPGTVARKDGDAGKALAGAAKVIKADFEFPYLAHAPMEPLDVVIRFDGAKATLWLGSQIQTMDQAVAAAILGLRPEEVEVNTLWAGGSFGRRATFGSPFVAEAAHIARAYAKPVPIKVMWTREDDIRGGYYRPAYRHRIEVGLDGSGKIVAWRNRIAGQSIMTGTPMAPQMVKDGVDTTSVEGASTLPYAIPNLEVELATQTTGVPILWWRSVGSSHTAHATEHMLDIIARETGQDPVALRLSLLAKHPRHRRVLERAAQMAGWAEPSPDGIARGVAVHESFNSFVAQVAEVRLDGKGGFKVERVVCAVDCGIAVNPDNIAAQMEGGIGYGLGHALRDAITLKDGVVEQSNFHDYEPMRISDMPTIEVHIIASTEPPTGVGEPGVPPIAPAVANALLAATGVRTLALPFTRQRYAKG